MKNKNIYVPHYDKKTHAWRVSFRDRPEESGDVTYVVSEYLWNGLIYEYNCDGKRCHEHSFSGVLASIIHDLEEGCEITFNGFEDEYSDQELELLTQLVSRMTYDMNNFTRTQK